MTTSYYRTVDLDLIPFLLNDAITSVEELGGIHVDQPVERVIYLSGYCTGKCSYLDEVLARHGVKIDDTPMVPDCYG